MLKRNLSSSAFPYVESKHLAVNGEMPVHGSLTLNLSTAGKGLRERGAERARFIIFRKM